MTATQTLIDLGETALLSAARQGAELNGWEPARLALRLMEGSRVVNDMDDEATEWESEGVFVCWRVDGTTAGYVQSCHGGMAEAGTWVHDSVMDDLS